MDKNPAMKDSVIRRKKSFHGYHYRRRSKVNFAEQYAADLVHVLGLTLKNNCAFCCDPNTGLLAYPAGCVIVLHNPRADKQSFVFNPGQKTITCLRFTKDGNFIATGESGHQPCVRVFSVSERSQVASFSSHIYGISCVLFSPNSKYVISIGYQHDNVINVWDWKKNVLAASNKVSTKVKSVAFSDDSNYFVTVGNRHVKFWYLEKASTPDMSTVPLKGRSAILESFRNHMFCDVVCGLGSESGLTFAVTRSGLLCQFNVKRTVSRHVEIKSGSGRSISIINDTVLCGSGDGSIYLFTSSTLDFITNISPPDFVRGEILATAIDVRNMWLHTVYADHSLLITDVVDFAEPHTHSCSRFHNSCVWDVKVMPDSGEVTVLPQNSFLTCSNDSTLRLWTVESGHHNLLKIINLDVAENSPLETDGSAKFEARSICVRSDGKHAAVGDRSGNIHVYDLVTFDRLAFIPTHDGDVLDMDYSPTGEMLASASRGRCVNIFGENYVPTHTIADHSAAVTAVKFAQRDNEFRLITCGSDKSLYVCVINNNTGKAEISREQHFVEKHSMGDMAIVDESVLVACGSNVIEYDVFGGKQKRSFRGSESGANILCIAVNPHRTLLAASSADKNIYILGFMTGDCICVLNGHSEVAVSLTFDNESRLLSSSADSCVFVWRLSHRSADDIRNIQSLGGATSHPTTPENELNKTAYFANSEELTVEILGSQDSQEALDRKLPAAFDNFVSDDMAALTFEVNSDAEGGDSPAEAYLPAWVAKHGQAEPAPTRRSPLPALGKWGVRLEQKKVCEEIGNLAQSADLCSTVSSFEEETFAPDLKDELEAEGVIFDCDQQRNSPGAEDREPASKSDDFTSDDVIVISYDYNRNESGTGDGGSPRQPEAATSAPASRRDSGSFVEPGTDNLVKSLLAVLTDNKGIIENNQRELDKPDSDRELTNSVGENKPDSSGLDQSLKSPALVQQIDVNGEIEPSCEARAATGADAEVPHEESSSCKEDNKQSIDQKFIRGSESRDVIEQSGLKHDVEKNDDEVSERTSPACDSRPKPTCEGEASEEAFVPPHTSPEAANVDETASSERPCDDEHVDVRNVVHETGDRVQDADTVDKLATEAKSSFDERKVFVSSAVIQVCPSPRRPAEAAKDMARGVHVSSDRLTEEKESSEEEMSCEGNPQTSNPQSTVPVPQFEVRDVDIDHVTSARSGDSEDDDDVGLRDRTSDRSRKPASGFSDSPRTFPNSEIPPDQSVTSDAVNAASRTPPDKTPAMPPAFAELLASLTKRRPPRVIRSPPRTLSLFKTYNLKDEESSSDQEPQDTTIVNEQDMNEMDNESEPDETGSLTGSTSSLELGTESRHECEKASEDLMAVFNQAEAVYRRQKFNKLNGSRTAVSKLVHTFRTIHARIGDLQLIDDSDLSKKSLSAVNDLGTESSVVSLLREYSDKLVGLVESRMEEGKVLGTQSDTV